MKIKLFEEYRTFEGTGLSRRMINDYKAKKAREKENKPYLEEDLDKKVELDPFDEEEWDEVDNNNDVSFEDMDPEQKIKREIDRLCDQLNLDKNSPEIQNHFNNIMMIMMMG